MISILSLGLQAGASRGVLQRESRLVDPGEGGGCELGVLRPRLPLWLT